MIAVPCGFDGDIEANLVSVFEAIDDRSGDIGDFHRDAFDHVGFHTNDLPWPRESDDFNRRIVDPRVPSFAVDRNPHTGRILGGNFMERER